MTVLSDLAALIPDARDRLKGVARITPVGLNQRLMEDTGSEVWLKREDLQPVRSYKLRGAYNLISQLPPKTRDAGVVCASADSHGQGVMFVAATPGIGVVVYVPTTTPRQKHNRIQALGRGHVELVMEGVTYDQVSRAAVRFAESSDRIPVPASSDPRTAAGQGVAIAEIVEQLGFVPDVVILPVGDGGSMPGVAAWLRAHHPQVRIIGVEPNGTPCVAVAVSAGRPLPLNNIDIFVDGAAISLVSNYAFDVIDEAKIELTRIPEGQVCSEILDMYQTDGTIAEPAEALASAALPAGGVGSRVHVPAGSQVLSIASGGGNDITRYADVVERSLLHEGRKHYFLANFSQQPNALRRFLGEVLGPDDDVTYFEYVRRSSREAGPALVGVEFSNPGDYRFLLARITECGMEVNEVDSTSPYFRFLVQRLIAAATGWGGLR